MKLKKEVAIVVATTVDYNIYLTDREILTPLGLKPIGNFIPIEYPHSFHVLSGMDIFGQNWEKWNIFLNSQENLNYEYYMFMHDDCYDFTLNWLDHMIAYSKENNDDLLLCHQDFSANGVPGRFLSSGIEYSANDDFNLYGGDEGLRLKLEEEINKRGLELNYKSVIGGSTFLAHNKVIKNIQKSGGFIYPQREDFPNGFSWAPWYEPINSAFLTSLGWTIKDFKVNDRHLFKHSTLLG